MPGMSDGELLEIASQVTSGDLLPEVAIEKITYSGDFLAIGGVATRAYHYPIPAQRAHTENVPKTYWSYILAGSRERNKAEPVLRAGSAASTAIHSALGGNINEQDERRKLGKLLTPPDKYYNGGTIGWDFDRNTGGYALSIHEDLQTAMELIDDEEEIGNVDFVDRGDFRIAIPEEPGHFASRKIHETVGSIPIFMGDVRRNIRQSMAQRALRLLKYKPLDYPAPRRVLP